jgi:hypothetical protein
LRKALILKNKKNQDIFWNRFCWFYVQQKNLIRLYSRKAIYKRNPESLANIVSRRQLRRRKTDAGY